MCLQTDFFLSGWLISKVLVTPDRNRSSEISGPVTPPDGAQAQGLDGAGRERIDLSTLAPGTCLELKTRHNSYTLQYLGEGRVEICGHPQYCPVPTVVRLQGSSLGVGLRFEFHHPAHSLVTTSRIIALRRVG
jgi:hypothetical protein